MPNRSNKSNSKKSSSKVSKGFDASLLLLATILIIVGLIVIREVDETDKAVSNSADQVTKVSKDQVPSNTEVANMTPEGWVEYESQELGIVFAYPIEWGEVSVATQQGYVPEDSMVSPGTEYRLRFSNNANLPILFLSWTNGYSPGPKGPFPQSYSFASGWDKSSLDVSFVNQTEFNDKIIYGTEPATSFSNEIYFYSLNTANGGFLISTEDLSSNSVVDEIAQSLRTT